MAMPTRLGESGRRLLEDSCSWEAYSGEIENLTTGDKEPGFAAPSTLPCLVNSPSRVWRSKQWPLDEIDGAMEFLFAYDVTVGIQDRVTHNELRYRILDTHIWPGTGVICLAERKEGQT